jgi:hypothetical protein
MSAELEFAKAELARVKAEAVAAQLATERLQAHLTKSRRDTKVRLRVIAVVMLTAALIKTAWQSAQAPPVSGTAPLPIGAAGILSAPNVMRAANTPDSPQNREFVRSLNRLRDAFHSFPDEDQIGLIQEINENRPMACPLAWNEAGIPSLFVGDKKGETPPSMIAALNQCASAIEKLRVKIDSAQ